MHYGRATVDRTLLGTIYYVQILSEKLGRTSWQFFTGNV